VRSSARIVSAPQPGWLRRILRMVSRSAGAIDPSGPVGGRPSGGAKPARPWCCPMRRHLRTVQIEQWSAAAMSESDCPAVARSRIATRSSNVVGYARRARTAPAFEQCTEMLERMVAPRTNEYNSTRLWARPPARDGETQQCGMDERARNSAHVGVDQYLPLRLTPLLHYCFTFVFVATLLRLCNGRTACRC